MLIKYRKKVDGVGRGADGFGIDGVRRCAHENEREKVATRTQIGLKFCVEEGRRC